jgi:hypothetical protein
VASGRNEAGGRVSQAQHLTLRSGPQGRVSKGGNHDWLRPFETHRYAVLLRVRRRAEMRKQ